MKLIIFSALMIICSASKADWEVTSTDDEATMYHDKSTIRRNGSIVKMWSMTDYVSAQTDADGNDYKSIKWFEAYNCKEETSALISLAMYSDSAGGGNLIFSYTKKEADWDWEPLIPESNGVSIWKIACGKK